MAYQGEPVRVLVIPGLRGSGRTHWQTWLQSQFRGSRRVEQVDQDQPTLEVWSRRIGEVLDEEPPGEWIAVAHSFGCLALARHLAERRHRHVGVSAVLMVAPAEPAKFSLDAALPHTPLGVPGHVLASDTDPWMTADSARSWARRWSLGFSNLGDAGHINADAGFGPLPLAKHLTQRLLNQVQRSHRLERVSVAELRFAV